MKTCDVVMPTFGQSEATLKCLRTLARGSSVRDFRLIWVDNGSTPSERAAVSSFLANVAPFEHLDLLLPDNLGFVKATNAGIAASTAPFVLLLNNDTEVPVDWLEKLSEPMRLERQIGIVGPLTDNPLQWQGEERIRRWPPHEGRAGYRTLNWSGAMLAFFCAMIRREVVVDVGYLSESFGVGLGDDDDYCARARAAGWMLALRTDLVVRHLHRTTFRAMYSPEELEGMTRKAMEVLDERRKKS